MILVQWNEVNFPILRKYADKYDLKSLTAVLKYNQTITHSETKYELLEPWIQWASVNTSLPFEKHKIFRLGDVVLSDKSQIYEEVEKKGFKVGAISPMNALNRLKDPSYFIPDPWTDTHSDNSFTSKQLTAIIRQTVNDNAAGKITFLSYVSLIIIFMRFASRKHWTTYVSLAIKSRKRKWCKALFLDLLLSDVHNKMFLKESPDFSTLFLNGFAHIQHHYFLNSEFSEAPIKMPEWYIASGVDPLYDAVIVYDKIAQSIIENAEERPLLFATGLSQQPYHRPIFYYRLADHSNFMQLLGFERFIVQPRMTRDFQVTFSSEKEAKACKDKLESFSVNNKVLFEVEQRCETLFATLVYDEKITENDRVKSDSSVIQLLDHVVFVAIKNGHHCETGYIAWSNLPNHFLSNELEHVSMLGEKITDYFTDHMSD